VEKGTHKLSNLCNNILSTLNVYFPTPHVFQFLYPILRQSFNLTKEWFRLDNWLLALAILFRSCIYCNYSKGFSFLLPMKVFHVFRRRKKIASSVMVCSTRSLLLLYSKPPNGATRRVISDAIRTPPPANPITSPSK